MPARNRSGNGNRLGTDWEQAPHQCFGILPPVSWSTIWKWARGQGSRKMNKPTHGLDCQKREWERLPWGKSRLITLSGCKELSPVRTSWDDRSNLPRDVIESHHWSFQDVTGQGATESHPSSLPSEVWTGSSFGIVSSLGFCNAAEVGLHSQTQQWSGKGTLWAFHIHCKTRE